MHYGLGKNGLWNKISCDIVHFLPLLCVRTLAKHVSTTQDTNFYLFRVLFQFKEPEGPHTCES